MQRGMSKREFFYGATGRIAESIRHVGEKKRTKKLDEAAFDKLMAELEDMRLGRELQERGLDIQEDQLEAYKEKWGKEYELKLQDALQNAKLTDVQIKKVNTEIKKIEEVDIPAGKADIAATEALGETRTASAALTKEKTKLAEQDVKLGAEATNLILNSIDTRPPLAPPTPEQMRTAKGIKGIPAGQAGRAGTQDQAIKQWLFKNMAVQIDPISGDISITNPDVFKQGVKLFHDFMGGKDIGAGQGGTGGGTPQGGGGTPQGGGGIPQGGAPQGGGATLAPGGVPTMAAPQTKPQIPAPAATMPTPARSPTAAPAPSAATAPPKPATAIDAEIMPNDPVDVIATKLLGYKGDQPLTPEEMTALEQNMRKAFGDSTKAAQVMSVLRKRQTR